MAVAGTPKPQSVSDAKPQSVSDAVPPDASVDLTPEQLELQRLRAELAALKAASSSTAPKSTRTDDKEGDTIIVHFVRDGWISGGIEYYSGQEVEYTVGDQAYLETCNPITGESWLNMRNDPREQERRKGFEYFRDGPWKGLSYVDNKYAMLMKVAEDSKLDLPSRLELEQAELAEKSRRRKVAPMMNSASSQTRPRG